jgi:hypothetical protein
VSALLTPVAGGASLAATQLLTQTGVRGWGAFGATLGVASSGWIPVACTSGGYISMHRDGAGAIRIQQQDSFGEPLWGSLPNNADGMEASWTNGAIPLGPILAPDGPWTSCWANPGPSYLGPPSVIHAMELDPAGEIAPGWPAEGHRLRGSTVFELDDAIARGAVVRRARERGRIPATAPRAARDPRRLDVSPSPPARAPEMSPPSPNPSRGGWPCFALREAAQVTLEAFDTAGRRVLQHDLEATPGAHVVSRRGSLAPSASTASASAPAPTPRSES